MSPIVGVDRYRVNWRATTLRSIYFVATDPDKRESTRWKIHGERLVDDTRRDRVSIASVELPEGVTFEQWVFRIRKAAMMAVLDDQDRVLMLWRHRFIIDRWVWELPGGYVDPEEDPAVTAAREVEEETGWRPLDVEPLGSLQPLVGSADAENLLYVARRSEYIGEPVDINEAARVAWIQLDTVRDRIMKGEILGAASQVALLHILAFYR
ncbi:NUDIX hydrolase [Amycolatopsis sp. NPDC003731]